MIVNGDGAGMETNLSLFLWRKSSYSNNGGNCVEVASNLPGIIGVRDSKNPAGSVLTFTPGEWSAFLSGVKSGEFDA
ncbi:DUF397 domain-containing protein [Streptosporangium sp. NBC_01810]|uniref:DUF397 domain-containing protein n=1 Tax=Streptosporangium sp. NBC_01810 TaxID=2975951 RepID=UPI002DDB817E|nr:DUF397 domain-containing protein [Streptosporangium sp. NBC_01810]WSA25987.1 DUF397 domain-containing protein [Streptosporangium sp. NBC_01810]